MQNKLFIEIAEWTVTIGFSLVILVLAWQARLIVSNAWNALTREQEAISALSIGLPDESSNFPESLRETSVYRVLSDANETGVFDTDALPYTRKIQKSRYLAGIFVFLGLAGTVFGIAVSLTNLGIVTSGTGGTTASDLQKVMTAVGAVLGGMRSAAICTLVGIFATLIISWANNAYLVAADNLTSRAESIWQGVIDPKRRKHEQQLDWIRSRQLLSDVLQNIMLTVIEKENEATRQASKELAETIGNAQESQGKQLLEGMRLMAQALFEPSDALRETVVEFKQDIVSTGTWLSTAAQTAERVAHTLELTYKQQRETLLAIAEQNDVIHHQSERTISAMTQSLQTIDKGLGQLLGEIRTEVTSSLRQIEANGRQQIRTTDQLFASVTDFSIASRQSIDALSRDRDDREKERETWEIDLNAMLREQEHGRQSWTVERAESLTAFGQEREKQAKMVVQLVHDIQLALKSQQSMFMDAIKAFQTEAVREVKSIHESANLALSTSQKNVEAMKLDSRLAISSVSDLATKSLNQIVEESAKATDMATRFNRAADKTLDILEKAHDDQQSRTEKLIAGVNASERRLADLFAGFEKTLAKTVTLAENSELRSALQQTESLLTRSIEAQSRAIATVEDVLVRVDRRDSQRAQEMGQLALSLHQIVSQVRSGSTQTERPTTYEGLSSKVC